MSGFIPEEKISEIRSAADIVEIVSESVVLKKTGKDYVGLCPFHSEKTPSFTVIPLKQMYYCFGCGIGGDVFNFLMKKEGLSFPESVKILADRYGIELPKKEMSDEEKQKLRLREALFSVNGAALDFFRQSLEGPRGRAAREYLKGRGIDPSVLELFKIGFAPPGWENLITEFQNRRITADLAEQAGLIIPRKKGAGYYDRFRNRIIFPIIEPRGAVIGFGGRVMDDGMPKYLNSPESPIYHKSRSLYGLHHTLEKCRRADAVFLVEGYFDLIAMVQHGIENGAATLGTSLTPDHVRLLKRCASKAFLVYDSDPAGLRAAERSLDIFEKAGMTLRVMTLPDGYDPDTYLFKFGADEFYRIAENALSAFDFLMESKIRQHGLSLEGKVSIVSDLAEHLFGVADPVKRSLYIQAIAERVGVGEKSIQEKIGAVRKNIPPDFPSDDEPPPLWPDDLPHGFWGDDPGYDPMDFPASDHPMGTLDHPEEERHFGDRMERRMVAMLLQCPEMASEVARRGVVACFRNEQLKSIGEMLLNHPNPSPAETEAALADEGSRALFSDLSLQEETWRPDDCCRLMEQFLARRRPGEKDLQEKIRAAEQSNDERLLFELLKKKQLQALSACKGSG